MIKMFYDLETTGLDHMQHSIHEMAFMVQVDGVNIESFVLQMRPHPKAVLSPEALAKCKVTEAQIMAYPPAEVAHGQFKAIVDKYVDPYDKTQKIHLVGYNNRVFDDPFLRMWFLLMNDNSFDCYFWTDTLDALVLASERLCEHRGSMPSFKLSRVATTLGIQVDESQLHSASYDMLLTYLIYNKVTGKL